MSNLETIEQELRQYIEDSPNLNSQDRFVHLKAIFDKHFFMQNTKHILTMNDFQSIINYAKSHYGDIKTPAWISNREVWPNEIANIAVIEAVLSYLSMSKILNKLVKIDYTTK